MESMTLFFSGTMARPGLVFVPHFEAEGQMDEKFMKVYKLTGSIIYNVRVDMIYLLLPGWLCTYLAINLQYFKYISES